MSFHRYHQLRTKLLPRAVADTCAVSSALNPLFMRDLWVLLASRQEGIN
jgi:hypothetical protein